MEPEAIDGPLSQLGESPLWLAASQELVWVDVEGRSVLSVKPWKGALSLRVRSYHQRVSCVIPTSSGGLLAGMDTGIFLLEEESSPEWIAGINDPRVRMNDGGCDPRGSLIVGSTDLGFVDPIARLYTLAGSQLVSILDNVTISNGLDWPNENTMYYIDTPTRQIDVFDYDIEGPNLLNRRPFIRFEEEWGLPDGMTLDEAGNLWVACFSGSAVRAFDPKGELIDVIDLPVRDVTSCAFGGPDFRHLFITTASTGASDDTGSGLVYVAHTWTRGLPARRWAGVVGETPTGFGS